MIVLADAMRTWRWPPARRLGHYTKTREGMPSWSGLFVEQDRPEGKIYGARRGANHKHLRWAGKAIPPPSRRPLSGSRRHLNCIRDLVGDSVSRRCKGFVRLGNSALILGSNCLRAQRVIAGGVDFFPESYSRRRQRRSADPRDLQIWHDADEAGLARANDSPFALASNVFGPAIDARRSEFAHRSRAGAIRVNDAISISACGGKAAARRCRASGGAHQAKQAS